MVDVLEKAKESVEISESKKRLKSLKALIKAILSGKYRDRTLKIAPYEETEARYSPRQEYVSPEERGTYNPPGVMRIDEMMAGTDQAK